MKNWGGKLTKFVRSRVFFALTLVLFVVNAGWIALSARFPMAFDEGFHIGIIKIYAHQWSPLLLHQPAGPAPYGALTTDPSYLYHYLMSFPYRLLTSVFHNDMTVIIAMRFINIVLFTVALVLLRKLLLKTKAGSAMVNLTLLFFISIPVVPQLAGQNNYDNLMMVLVATSLLLAVRFCDQLRRQKRYNIFLLLNLFSFMMLASLVKYAFLPIFLAIVLYLLYAIYRVAGLRKKFWQMFHKHWRPLPALQKSAILVFFAISLGLFTQRYVYNTVRYQNPIPQCGQVLSVQQCMSYGPWARNYSFAQHKPPTSSANPVYFAGGWLYGMFWRSFFAINGPGNPNSYDNRPPLPLLAASAIIVFVFGLYAAIHHRRKIFRQDTVLNLLLFTSFAYIVALVGRNYHDYVQLGQLVAINGRYLVQIIVPVLLIVGLGWREFVAKKYRITLLAIVAFLFLQGGGALSFIYDSSTSWYWPGDHFAQRINHDAKQILHPFILKLPD